MHRSSTSVHLYTLALDLMLHSLFTIFTVLVLCWDYSRICGVSRCHAFMPRFHHACNMCTLYYHVHDKLMSTSTLTYAASSLFHAMSNLKSQISALQLPHVRLYFNCPSQHNRRITAQGNHYLLCSINELSKVVTPSLPAEEYVPVKCRHASQRVQRGWQKNMIIGLCQCS